MIDHQLSRCQDDPSAAVIYFYCDFRDSPQPRMGDLLASLLHQLLGKPASAPPALLRAHQDGDWGSQLCRSSQPLSIAVKQSSASLDNVYVFIDALDEFPSDEADKLVGLLSSMRSWNLPSMHVLVTSQFHGLTIRSSLQALTSVLTRLDLGAFIRSDIRTYVQHCLQRAPFCHRWDKEDSNIVDKMEHELVGKSDGS